VPFRERLRHATVLAVFGAVGGGERMRRGATFNALARRDRVDASDAGTLEMLPNCGRRLAPASGGTALRTVVGAWAGLFARIVRAVPRALAGLAAVAAAHARPTGEKRPAARRARIAAGTGAALQLGFLAGLVLVVEPLAVGDRALAYLVFTLPLLALLPTALATALAVSAWRQRFWGTASRLHLTLVALALLLFIPFLGYWNLLGFRF
jgi:hypothetical protein